MGGGSFVLYDSIREMPVSSTCDAGGQMSMSMYILYRMLGGG